MFWWNCFIRRRTLANSCVISWRQDASATVCGRLWSFYNAWTAWMKVSLVCRPFCYSLCLLNIIQLPLVKNRLFGDVFKSIVRSCHHIINSNLLGVCTLTASVVLRYSSTTVNHLPQLSQWNSIHSLSVSCFYINMLILMIVLLGHLMQNDVGDRWNTGKLQRALSMLGVWVLLHVM